MPRRYFPLLVVVVLPDVVVVVPPPVVVPEVVPLDFVFLFLFPEPEVVVPDVVVSVVVPLVVVPVPVVVPAPVVVVVPVPVVDPVPVVVPVSVLLFPPVETGATLEFNDPSGATMSVVVCGLETSSLVSSGVPVFNERVALLGAVASPVFPERCVRAVVVVVVASVLVF